MMKRGSGNDAPDSSIAGGVSPNDDKRHSVSVTADSVSVEEGPVDGGSGRVPKKFITTWRHACDKTKDRTRDLFKRWRTLPETAADIHGCRDDGSVVGNECSAASESDHGWSVHVWATWVKRYESDDEDGEGEEPAENAERLTPVQIDKLRHLFTHLLDTDHDQLVTVQDFDAFCQRLKHFADWSENSTEFITLQQVKEGFIQEFIPSSYDEDGKPSKGNSKPISEVISLEEWLNQWGILLHSARNMTDFPIWLQYLPKIIHQAINSSGSGAITREELSAFYSALLGLTTQDVNELLERAYNAMTANEEHPLTYSVYRLCFANFLLGRYPNGPGQYIFGHIGKHVDSFPIDYSAMNTPLNELEQYTPDKKTNRRSVIV